MCTRPLCGGTRPPCGGGPGGGGFVGNRGVSSPESSPSSMLSSSTFMWKGPSECSDGALGMDTSSAMSKSGGMSPGEGGGLFSSRTGRGIRDVLLRGAM